MNRRQRNLFLVVAACTAVGSLSSMACDPNYASKKGTGGGTATGSGGTDTQGAGGDTGGGLGGETGAGGTAANGTGGETSGGTGGMTGGGTGGMTGGGTGGMTGGGTGGMTGAGGGTTSGNLITNGDFAAGDTHWTWQLLVGTGNPAHGVQNGQYCVTVETGQQIIVGWPEARAATLQLPGNAPYVFSYKVIVTGQLPVNVSGKVGLFVTPFTADSLVIDITNMTNTGTRTFTRPFNVQTGGDPQAGIGMFIDGQAGNGTSQVCIDDVSLVPS